MDDKDSFYIFLFYIVDLWHKISRGQRRHRTIIYRIIITIIHCKYTRVTTLFSSQLMLLLGTVHIRSAHFSTANRGGISVSRVISPLKTTLLYSVIQICSRLYNNAFSSRREPETDIRSPSWHTSSVCHHIDVLLVIMEAVGLTTISSEWCLNFCYRHHTLIATGHILIRAGKSL